MSENEVSMIGNVRFYKSDIEKSSTHVDDNGGKYYSVWLKNGTNLTFRDQTTTGAYVMTGRDLGNGNKEGTAFAGIKGLSIQGSNKDDYYHLADCDYYVVNVKGGGKDEVRIVNTKGEPKNAKVNADRADNVYTVDTSSGISRSEGWFVGNMFPIKTPELTNDVKSGVAPKRHEESEYWSSKYNTETGLTGEVPHMKIGNPDGSRTLIFQWHPLDGIDYSKVDIKKNPDGTTRVMRYATLAQTPAELLKDDRANRIVGDAVDIDSSGTVVSHSFYGKYDKEGRPLEETLSVYNEDGSMTKVRYELSYSADGTVTKTQIK